MPSANEIENRPENVARLARMNAALAELDAKTTELGGWTTKQKPCGTNPLTVREYAGQLDAESMDKLKKVGEALGFYVSCTVLDLPRWARFDHPTNQTIAFNFNK
jgi:hypothetical protein